MSTKAFSGSFNHYIFTRDDSGQVIATNTQTQEITTVSGNVTDVTFSDFSTSLERVILSDQVLSGSITDGGRAYLPTNTPDKGRITFHNDGTYTYRPYEWADGTDVFEVKLLDSDEVLTFTLDGFNGGPETIYGTKDSDILTSTEGQDTIFNAGLGDDTVIGSDAQDTVILDGGINDYTFTRNADGSVTALNNQTDESDTLHNIDLIDFNDVGVRVLDSLVQSALKYTGRVPLEDGASYFFHSSPQQGHITLHNDGSFVYTPNEDATGLDYFTVKITQPDGSTQLSTVEVNTDTGETNNIPMVNADDYFRLKANKSHIFSADDLLANTFDADGEALFVTDIAVSHGTIVYNPQFGNWTYTPEAGFEGHVPTTSATAPAKRLLKPPWVFGKNSLGPSWMAGMPSA